MYLRQLAIDNIYTLLDCISLGTDIYDIDCFMNITQVETVLTEYKYNSIFWPVPIILPVDHNISLRDRIQLTYNDYRVCSLDVYDIFDLDLNKYMFDWFGTTSIHHPGVKLLTHRMKNKKFISGKVSNINNLLPVLCEQFTMLPNQLKTKMVNNSYQTTTNIMSNSIPHNIHSYIISENLPNVDSIGILLKYYNSHININRNTLLRCWSYYINNMFPPGKTILSLIPQYSNYSGIRERLLDIIVSQNYGFDYFINGPDNTILRQDKMISQKYAKDHISDFSIQLINIPEYYQHLHFGISDKKGISIEGRSIYKKIKMGRPIPDYYVLPDIVHIINNKR